MRILILDNWEHRDVKVGKIYDAEESFNDYSSVCQYKFKLNNRIDWYAREGDFVVLNFIDYYEAISK